MTTYDEIYNDEPTPDELTAIEHEPAYELDWSEK